jgi:ABC-type microcin C transport system duplicated ATPase subunit YejF
VECVTAGYDGKAVVSGISLALESGETICLLGANGATQAVYTAEKVVHDPKPLLPHPREKVIPWRIDLAKTTGHLVVADVYNGRNMAGVARGSVKEILIM